MRVHLESFPFSLDSPLLQSMNRRQIHQILNHLTTNVRGAMLQTFHKLNLKPKTILQQIRDDLPQTIAISCECMCFGRW